MRRQDPSASLARADRVEVVTYARALDVTTHITIRDGSRLASLLALLERSDCSPTGSIRAVDLGFYQGEQHLAAVWIYVTGAWGFIGGDGTVGRNATLVPFLLEQIAGGSDPDSQ